MRKIKRASQLTTSEWRYLATALAELLAARIRLAVIAPNRILRGLQDGSAKDSPNQNHCSANIDAARLTWAITAAARHVPWRADCLVTAMAADSWLRRHNAKPEFYVGVIRSEPEGLAAHAWLRYNGITVAGGKYDLFVPLSDPGIE